MNRTYYRVPANRARLHCEVDEADIVIIDCSVGTFEVTIYHESKADLLANLDSYFGIWPDYIWEVNDLPPEAEPTEDHLLFTLKSEALGYETLPDSWESCWVLRCPDLELRYCFSSKAEAQKFLAELDPQKEELC